MSNDLSKYTVSDLLTRYANNRESFLRETIIPNEKSLKMLQNMNAVEDELIRRINKTKFNKDSKGVSGSRIKLVVVDEVKE